MEICPLLFNPSGWPPVNIFEPDPTLQQRRFPNLSTLYGKHDSSLLRFKPVTPKYGVPLHSCSLNIFFSLLCSFHSCRVPPQPRRCFVSEQTRHTYSELFTPKKFQSNVLVTLEQESYGCVEHQRQDIQRWSWVQKVSTQEGV